MNKPGWTLELSRLRQRGIAAAFIPPDLFTELFGLLWELDVLTPSACNVAERELKFDNPHAACRMLTHRAAFLEPDVWALLWSVSHASMEMAMQGLQASHEPELNGTYMALLRSSISQFAGASGHSGLACVIGDHATLGNEARTGADFGLIVELGAEAARRYVVCLLQAKRATSRIVDVRRAAGDSTQLDRLVSSGIGSYLFYHCHGDPPGLGPTIRDAHAVSMGGPARTGTVWGADDFAVRLATAAHLVRQSAMPFALPGFGAATSRSDAARLLFNPDVPGVEVNDVLVARIGGATKELAGAVRFESEWSAVISEHRDMVDRTRRHWDDGDELEPPIICD